MYFTHTSILYDENFHKENHITNKADISAHTVHADINRANEEYEKVEKIITIQTH